jgi:hypothetical protein
MSTFSPSTPAAERILGEKLKKIKAAEPALAHAAEHRIRHADGIKGME